MKELGEGRVESVAVKEEKKKKNPKRMVQRKDSKFDIQKEGTDELYRVYIFIFIYM
jgi:hypothetical protein